MIVDTSVVIDAVERRSVEAIAALSRLTERSIRSMVVAGELEFGVCAAQRGGDARQVDLRRTSRDYYRLISEPGDAPPLELIAEWFGEISALASTTGIRLGQNDRWILAEGRCWRTPVLTADATMNELARLLAVDSDIHPTEVAVLVARN